MLQATLNFNPFPILQTSRLLLRRLDKSDANAVIELRSNAETMQYIPRPLITSADEAIAHLQMIDDKINTNTGIDWAITLPGDNHCLGIIGFYRCSIPDMRAEIGYILLPEYRGRGIISEAIAAVIDYGFATMRLHSIEAVIDPGNRASARVLEKQGFIEEGHLHENIYFDGKFLDSIIYSLINK